MSNADELVAQLTASLISVKAMEASSVETCRLGLKDRTPLEYQGLCFGNNSLDYRKAVDGVFYLFHNL